MEWDWRLPERATRLVLLRHGEPEASARGRIYGRLDVDLSSEGIVQAERAAARLASAPLVAVYSSPRRRALRTALAIAQRHGLEVRPRMELAELDFGRLEGLTYDEAAQAHPAVWAEWMAHPTLVTFPGGESFAGLRARVDRFVGALPAAHPGATVALVAHGGVNRALVAGALGMAAPDLFRIDQSFGALSVIDFVDGQPLVRCVNCRP
jgi:alpha-ribazole phosphatase/probable phosphoglycerate mutase